MRAQLVDADTGDIREIPGHQREDARGSEREESGGEGCCEPCGPELDHASAVARFSPFRRPASSVSPTIRATSRWSVSRKIVVGVPWRPSSYAIRPSGSKTLGKRQSYRW
jgi:hypothetical protein